MKNQLGYFAASATGTIEDEINFVDGAGNPANHTGLAASLYPLGSTSAEANASVSFAQVGSITGCYKMTVTISGGGLTAGTYVVRCTAGTVGTPTMALTGVTLASVIVNASGTQGVAAVTVSDKTDYSLAADQAVNATKIGGTLQTAGVDITAILTNQSVLRALGAPLGVLVTVGSTTKLLTMGLDTSIVSWNAADGGTWSLEVTTLAPLLLTLFDGTHTWTASALTGPYTWVSGGSSTPATVVVAQVPTGTTIDTVTTVTNGVTLAANQHVIVDSGTVTSVTNAVVLPTGTGAGQISLSGGYVTYANPAPPSAATIAALILATPANKLVTDADGSIRLSNADEAYLSAAGGAADPLLNDVPGSYAAGTAGYALGNLGGGISSYEALENVDSLTYVSTGSGSLRVGLLTYDLFGKTWYYNGYDSTTPYWQTVVGGQTFVLWQGTNIWKVAILANSPVNGNSFSGTNCFSGAAEFASELSGEPLTAVGTQASGYLIFKLVPEGVENTLQALSGNGLLSVRVVSPVAKNRDITVYRGDAYNTTTAQVIEFFDDGTWPTMTSNGVQLATVQVLLSIESKSDLSGAFSAEGIVTGDSPSQTIAISLTGTQTASLVAGNAYIHTLAASMNHPTDTQIRSLVAGEVIVKEPADANWQ